MNEWAIERFSTTGTGPRLGVKDIIDIAGTRTSAGSRLAYSRASNASKNATVVENAIIQGAQIAAKTVLTEFAFGATGINPWFGTPTNPLNPKLIPGGSSSGSAVGVAIGELDCAIGSDTGGSIRIPSACCGIYGLKTTFGRIPLNGVWPLSPSMDTLGPMAKTVDNIELCMSLLEPGFKAQQLNNPKVAVIGESCSATEFKMLKGLMQRIVDEVFSCNNPGLSEAWDAGMKIMFVEAMKSNYDFLSESHRIDPAVMRRFATVSELTTDEMVRAYKEREIFIERLLLLFEEYDFLALPTLRVKVPLLKNAFSVALNANTMPFNLAGFPSISIPVPMYDKAFEGINKNDTGEIFYFSEDPTIQIPWSIQIVGRPNSESELVGFAKQSELILSAM